MKTLLRPNLNLVLVRNLACVDASLRCYRAPWSHLPCIERQAMPSDDQEAMQMRMALQAQELQRRSVLRLIQEHYSGLHGTRTGTCPRGGLLSLGDPRAAISHNPIPSKRVYLEPASPTHYVIQKSRSMSTNPLAPSLASVMPTTPLRPAFVRKLGLSSVAPSSGKEILRSTAVLDSYCPPVPDDWESGSSISSFVTQPRPRAQTTHGEATLPDRGTGGTTQHAAADESAEPSRTTSAHVDTATRAGEGSECAANAAVRADAGHPDTFSVRHTVTPTGVICAAASAPPDAAQQRVLRALLSPFLHSAARRPRGRPGGRGALRRAVTVAASDRGGVLREMERHGMCSTASPAFHQRAHVSQEQYECKAQFDIATARMTRVAKPAARRVDPATERAEMAEAACAAQAMLQHNEALLRQTRPEYAKPARPATAGAGPAHTWTAFTAADRAGGQHACTHGVALHSVDAMEWHERVLRCAATSTARLRRPFSARVAAPGARPATSVRPGCTSGGGAHRGSGCGVARGRRVQSTVRWRDVNGQSALETRGGWDSEATGGSNRKARRAAEQQRGGHGEQAVGEAPAPSTLSLQRRHGSGGVNAWEKPTDPASWKGEHTVIAVLSGWGIVIYGASQALGGKKKDVASAESPAAASADKADSMVAQAKETASQTAAQAKETASKTATQAKEAVAEAKDTASKAAADAKESVSKTATQAQESASKTATDVKEKASSAAADAKEKASAAIDSVQKNIDAIAGEDK
eukprot:jgi/Ulvmu1/1322/UM011_0050.1